MARSIIKRLGDTLAIAGTCTNDNGDPYSPADVTAAAHAPDGDVIDLGVVLEDGEYRAQTNADQIGEWRLVMHADDDWDEHKHLVFHVLAH